MPSDVSAATMVDLPFAEISRRLRAYRLPAADLVVGVARGGVVPASLVAHELGCELRLLHVNYRDDANAPRYAAPHLLQTPGWSTTGCRRILLVDDVAVSGKTLDAAREAVHALAAQTAGAGTVVVETFVLKGRADHVLFPDVGSCVNWPWKPV